MRVCSVTLALCNVASSVCHVASSVCHVASSVCRAALTTGIVTFAICGVPTAGCTLPIADCGAASPARAATPHAPTESWAARYVTCAQLANELAEAADDHKLSRVVARYGRYDLLAIDELGYVHLDAHSAELLFQILTEREERASVAIATNAPFSEWSKTFTDKRLAAAVVDRITYRAHIIQTGTTSYRLTSR